MAIEITKKQSDADKRASDYFNFTFHLHFALFLLQKNGLASKQP